MATMGSPLTSKEWKLVHQVMDQVDAQRHTDTVNVERVREVVVSTYRTQGIEIDDAAVDRILAGQAQEKSGQDSQVLTIDLDQVRADAQKGAQKQKLQRLKEERERANHPIYRMKKHWEEKRAPFLRHFPAEDGVLMRRLNAELVTQTHAYRHHRRWFFRLAVLFVLGLGGMVATTLAGVGVFPSPWEGWGTALFITAWLVTIFSGSWAKISKEVWLEAAMKITRLAQARQALERKDYDAQELAEGLRVAGYLVRGSLAPMEDQEAARRRLENRVEALSQEDADVKKAWKAWVKEKEVIRKNDLAITDAFVKMMMAHPLRGANWKRLLNRSLPA